MQTKFNVAATPVITGIGVISPVGNSLEEILQSLYKCEDGIKKAGKIDVSKFASRLCAEHSPFDFASVLSDEELQVFTDPFLRLAIASARLCIKNSNAEYDSGGKNEDIAIVAATCNGAMNSSEIEYSAPEKFTREVSFQSEFYSLGKALACALKIGGEIYVVNTACSGSTAALTLAACLIESGRYKKVLVGGADAVAVSNYAGFNAIKVVSPNKIAPFSEPVGMNIGEGAAFWFIESSDVAKNRNAKIFGKIIGHATTADAYHPTQPDPRGDGVWRTMQAAIEDAQVAVSDLGCINAHASGTLANDRAEAKGILKFCGSEKIPVTSTKSFMGHCMGATGILEATTQLIAMNESFIPPTLHFTVPRQGCEELCVVANKILEKSYDVFLSSNYAFAGNNAAVVIAKESYKSKPKQDAKKRIVVTGLGAVSSIGANVNAILESLQQGVSGIKKVERYPFNENGTSLCGAVSKPDTAKLDRRIDFSGLNPISTFATMAVREALVDSGVRIDRHNSTKAALTMSVSAAADDDAHMRGVFGTPDMRGDLACFSNVTANSTAGWVSKSLEIKGPNITLTSGPDSALQSLIYSTWLINRSVADFALAAGADEIFEHQMRMYAKLGLLYSDDAAANLKLSNQDNFKSVYGEGAASVLIEPYESALARGAHIYAEVLGYGAFSDTEDFYDASLNESALERSILKALEDSDLKPENIDIVSFAPKANAQDDKILRIIKKYFPQAKVATSTLNTGFVETSSSLINLIAVLKSLSNGEALWADKSNLTQNQSLKSGGKNILALASSNAGNNYAIVLTL